MFIATLFRPRCSREQGKIPGRYSDRTPGVSVEPRPYLSHFANQAARKIANIQEEPQGGIREFTGEKEFGSWGKNRSGWLLSRFENAYAIYVMYYTYCARADHPPAENQPIFG